MQLLNEKIILLLSFLHKHTYREEMMWLMKEAGQWTDTGGIIVRAMGGEVVDTIGVMTSESVVKGVVIKVLFPLSWETMAMDLMNVRMGNIASWC